MKKQTVRKKTSKKPIPVKSTVTIRAWPILCDAVERAIDAGFHKAGKYSDAVSDLKIEDEMSIKNQIEIYVLNAISEIFDFNDKYED